MQTRELPVLLVAAVATCAAQSRTADEPAIRAAIHAEERAFNEKDAKASEQPLAPDWTARSTTTGQVTGRRPIAEIEKTYRERPNVKQTRTVDHIVFVTPAVAIADGTIQTTGITDAKGNPIAPRSLVTWVLRKDEGAWRIVATRLGMIHMQSQR